MCGLFGVAGNLGFKEKDAFNQLMVVASLRGIDSSGVAAINEKNHEAAILKMVGTPYELQSHPKYDQTARYYSCSALIGHVRKATQGGISRLTAHPFHTDHIVMTHNGTLTGWRSAWKSVEGNYMSDSQKLTDAVAALGIRDTIAETEGAYALVWYDQERQSLNFLRNKERDLWYAMSEKGDVVYWASEWRMLQLVLDRLGIDLWREDKTNARFHSLPVNSHVEWSLGGNGNGKSVTIRNEDELIGGTSVKTHVPLTGNYGYQGGRRWENGQWSSGSVFQNQDQWDGLLDHELEVPLTVTKIDAKDKNLPVLSPPGTTVQDSGSQSTPSSTIPLADPPKTPSKTRRPSLTLVPSNKKSTSEKSKPSGTETKDGLIEGFAGEILDEKGYMEASHGKCAFCDTDVSYKEAQSGHIEDWVARDRFICIHCTGERAVVCC